MDTQVWPYKPIHIHREALYINTSLIAALKCAQCDGDVGRNYTVFFRPPPPPCEQQRLCLRWVNFGRIGNYPVMRS